MSKGLRRTFETRVSPATFEVLQARVTAGKHESVGEAIDEMAALLGDSEGEVAALRRRLAESEADRAALRAHIAEQARNQRRRSKRQRAIDLASSTRPLDSVGTAFLRDHQAGEHSSPIAGCPACSKPA